ncbi:MAG: ATP synthase subunit I [Xanthomonadales bacterium]|nr:ATP synthase subunit I [Xanthomonadales bacterium]
MALLVAAAFLLRGKHAALAALFGGVIIVLPTAYFALAVLVRGGQVRAHKMPGVFYRAEVTKLVLMALGFVLGALWFGKMFAPLILTSAACLAVNWFMLAALKSK